jgi:peptidoglycan-N-acetylglucosamine deacetylase
MKMRTAPILERCVGFNFCSLLCLRPAHAHLSWDRAGIRVFLLVLPLLVLSCTISFAEDRIGAAVSGAPLSYGITFGSQAILSMLWTPEELKGKPEDKQSIRQKYRNLPQRLIPGNIHPPLSPELQNSIRRVEPIGNNKIIALTFDLCESANEKSGYDADIVNYLRGNHIQATFFAGGKWMLSHAEKTLQLMVDPLFEVGNHSWSHANFRMIDARRMDEQILWTQAQYELLWESLRERVLAKKIDTSEMNKIPKTPIVFRFPYGACSPQALDKLKQYGLPAIQWDIVTGDPAKGRSARDIARVILEQVRPGAIIICHANGRGYGTAASLPLFVPELRALGYDFVTVSELLTQGSVVSSRECYELMSGDNLRYDRTAGKPNDSR